MRNVRRCFSPECTLSLTVVTRDRRPWLRPDNEKRRVLAALAGTRAIHPFRNIGHVILDDHLHWLLAPVAATDPSRLVSAFKRALIWDGSGARGGTALWQRRFHDHIIRDENDLFRHLDYIHYNPVRNGCCARPADYPWSSFAAWCARGVYDAEWGASEPDVVRAMDIE